MNEIKEQFFDAIFDGNKDKVKTFLDDNVININALDRSTGNTPLIICAMKNFTEIADLLLSHKNTRNRIKINIHNSTNSLTAFTMAAQMGNLGMIELLLTHPTSKNKINVNIKSAKNYTALIAASEYGHADIVKLLLTHEVTRDKIDVNVMYSAFWTDWNSKSRTAIMFASEYGHNKIVKLLLNHPDTELYYFDDESYDSLMLASKNGHANIVTTLLNHEKLEQLNLNRINEYGVTALIDACTHSYTEVVRVLLTNENSKDKIDIMITDNTGCTAEMIARENGNHEIIKLLTEFKKNKIKRSNTRKRRIIEKPKPLYNNQDIIDTPKVA